MTRVHIACSARNAGPWLDAFLESLVAQTHDDWELWMRDDGSTDDTWARLDAWRAREPRIARAWRGERSLGTALGFGDVLARLPSTAGVVATADADDVWMPHRLARTLAALRSAEAERPGAVLVHTDLAVVDDALRPLAPSFWRSEGISPEPRSLRSLAIQNVAVGPTLLFNAALLAELRVVPPGAIHQDWWIALVAWVTGRLVAVPEATVYYRQHGGNVAGARRQSAWERAGGALARRARVASDLDTLAHQAAALLAALGDRMPPADRTALAGLASIATRRGWRRRAAIARWRWFAGHGVLRNVGVVLRG